MYKAFIQNIIKFSLYVIVPRPAVRRLVFLLTLSAVVLVNLPEAVAKTCDEAATAPGWLDQPKIAERTDVVIVFIHGILGSAETWCNENGIYWPRLVADDKRFSRARIYVAEYSTRIRNGAYKIEDAAKEFCLNLNSSGVFNTQSLLFIAHSLGGIITRYALTTNCTNILEDRDPFNGKILGLLLIASPSIGSNDADRFAFLIDRVGNEMAKQLSPSSEFLHVLDSRFYRTIKLTKYRFLVGEEWVENFSILPWYISLIPGWSKPTVERHSGGRYFNTIQAPNGQMMPNTDHFSIVKPAGADALPHQWLWAFYQNKFAPRVQLPAIVDTADQILQSIDGPKSLVDSDGEYARTRTEIQKLSDQCEKIAVSFCDAVVARVGTEVDRHFSLFEAALQKAHNARAKFREFGDHRAELYSAWISLDTAIEAKDWEQARVELIAYQDLASSIASATEIDVDDPDYAWYNNWNMIVDLLEIELNLETGFVKAAESQLQGLSRQITSIGTPAHRLLQLQVSIMLAGKMKSERDIVSMSSRKRTVCVQMEYKFDRELQICLGQLNIIEAGAWIEAGRESSAKGAAIEAESRAEAAGDLAMRAESLYLWAKSDSLSHSISSEAQNRLSEAAEISGNIGWSPMMYKIFDLRNRLPSDQNTQPP